MCEIWGFFKYWKALKINMALNRLIRTCSHWWREIIDSDATVGAMAYVIAP